MRLRKLVLHGFKSFADRTEFVFDAPITGIVGPNGCGKSNVVDAFKWVLGEQSAKSLRGDAMLDVIFNGASTRKPSNMAEVVLVFDNPKRADETRVLPLDVDEVAVGRCLYRDGTSEYSVNGKGSRLKDIRELFLDTGIGVDAYSVIEQGRVAQLLDANPQERRLIFEEAAGISKFKQRKKEAQRKLEKVDQNLLRVTDVVDEVERRLRGVRVQAGKARVFQEHNTRLAELRLEYAFREYHTYRAELTGVEAQSADAKFRLDDAATEVSRATALLDEKKEAEGSVSAARQKAEYELVEIAGALDRAKQTEAFAQRQLSQTDDQIAALEQEGVAAGERLHAARTQLESERARLKELTAEVDGRMAEITRLQETFKQGQLRLHQLTQDAERQKAAVLDAMRRHAQTSNRLGAIEIERKNIGTHQELQAERRRQVVADLEAQQARKGELDGKLAEAQSEIAARQADFDAAKVEAQQLGKQVSTLTEHVSAAKEHRSTLLGRQKVLQDLEQKQQGVSEGVKSVLRRRGSDFAFVRGLVADVLRVDIEHAKVIESALDGRDQWLVVSSVSDALNAASLLAKLEGRVNLVAADAIGADGAVAEVAGGTTWGVGPNAGRGAWASEVAEAAVPVRLALDLVRVEPEYGAVAERLLRRVAIVEDVLAAEHMRQHGPKDWRYVTAAGEVLDVGGTFHAGPPSAAMGLLTRRSELEQLVSQLADADRKIAELTAELQGASAAVKALEQRQSDLRNAIYQANTRRVETSSAMSQVTDRINALNREQPLLDRELAALLDQQGRLASEETTLQGKRAEIEAQQQAAQQAAEAAVSQHAALAEELRSDGERLAQARVAIAEFQQRQIAARQHEGRLSTQVSEFEQQIVRIRAQGAQAAERQESLAAELETAQREQATLGTQRDGLKARAAELAERLGELTAAVREVAAALEAARASHAAIDQELSKLAVRGGELTVRIETVVSRTRDELQIEIAERYAELEGYSPAEKDWDAVAGEIGQLKEKIHRLGNVNVDSIAEQDELEARSNFLAKEVGDLREAKGQLEKLIEEINAESSVRFQQTFELVREHFQGLFRKLFGGGKADLYLETELAPKQQTITITHADGTTTSEPAPMIKVDPLDAGIEVIARPPGKQPVSISQLSGGEKTMTCVALLMSIFKSKPSPFCILDEVDAALDEANNARFNLIVQEFLDKSQFIIITHSKRSMTIADQLYGITQQEQGVSRRVAVKFDQIGKDGRIDASAVKQAEAEERKPKVEVTMSLGKNELAPAV